MPTFAGRKQRGKDLVISTTGAPVCQEKVSTSELMDKHCRRAKISSGVHVSTPPEQRQSQGPKLKGGVHGARPRARETLRHLLFSSPRAPAVPCFPIWEVRDRIPEMPPLLVLRFSDAKTITLGKGFWFLKRGLWQIWRQGVGDGSPGSSGGTLLTGNIPES